MQKLETNKKKKEKNEMKNDYPDRLKGQLNSAR